MLRVVAAAPLCQQHQWALIAPGHFGKQGKDVEGRLQIERPLRGLRTQPERLIELQEAIAQRRPDRHAHVGPGLMPASDEMLGHRVTTAELGP